ncbi:MAG: insulinase family protein [Leptospirales bacterium]|nr:insulinase family protein [Leptospirales bacterium]
MKGRKFKYSFKGFFIVLLLPLLFSSKAVSMTGFELPRVEKRTTAGGASLFFIKDDLPRFSLSASFGYGQLYEDEKSAGTADLLADYLMLAGSEKYPGQKLNEAIYSMGGSISVNSSWERTSVSIYVLHRFREQAVDILKDLLVNPRLDDAESFETAKRMQIDQIKRRYDDPAGIAFFKTRSLIFNGEGYGSEPSVKSVGAITLNDIKKTWNNYFTAGNLIAGIIYAGDFASSERLVLSALGSIREGSQIDYASDYVSAIKNVKESSGKIYLYPKEIPQATIVAGTAAPNIHDKRNPSFDVMNFILGRGSFNSRLMNEIRVKRGLAYSVGSVIRARAHIGVFLAYAQTSNSNVGVTMELLVDNINGMAMSPPSADELSWAKKSITNSYIFTFDTPQDILSQYITRFAYNLPDNYYESYPDKINLVESVDVETSALGLFEPGLVKVVVGSRDLIPVLEKYGKVEVLTPDED